MTNSKHSIADIDRITGALRTAPELLERLMGPDGAASSAELEYYVTALPGGEFDASGKWIRGHGPLAHPPGTGWRIDHHIGDWGMLWVRTKPGSAPSPALTASDLWGWHRAILGGRSSATGASLPEDLAQCPPGAQGAHWGLALILALLQGQEVPPVPLGVSQDEQIRIRELAGEIMAKRGSE